MTSQERQYSIDAHCHLADPRLDQDRDAYLKDAKVRGIGMWIQGGVGPDDWDRQLALKAKHPGQILTSFGVHPWFVGENSKYKVETALTLLSRRLSEADAIGETGLDYVPKFRDSKELQVEVFEKTLTLAKTSSKPLVLHIVRAHEDALKILKAHGKGTGLVHSYSGDERAARKYLELGYTLSISGSILNKNYATLKSVVKGLPAEGFVVETDAPDQLPQGLEGPLNRPAYLIEIARAIGEIRGEREDMVLERSSEILRKLFKIHGN